MKRWHWIALGLLAVASFVTELLTPHDPAHAAHWWNTIPGFYALFGFIGCVAIIVLSKWIGMLLLQRREEYYD